MMFEVCWSLALDKTRELVFIGFLACYWFGVSLFERRRQLRKESIAILMKETKMKTSLLSLTLEPKNKSLVRSINL